MLTKESASPNFDLPEEVLEVLPSDPFEQLDVARKITSIALSTRISALETQTSVLDAKLNDKDALIADLQAQIESLDASLSETADKLARADQEKESLLRENVLLSSKVKKLNRDVVKLESFRKTLMQSLKEDEESSAGAPQVVATHIPSHASLSSTSFAGEEDATLPPSRASSIRSEFSETGNSYAEYPETDASRPRISQGLLLASQTSTPRLSPPGSPPSFSASVSPTRTSKPGSPRRHSISFSTTRGMFDDRSSVYYSMPSSQHSSMSGSDTGSQSGRTRVDGKEFFRQVRSRLSYEQFGAFLANVKELNSHKQTREETLRKADEIFGPDNKDLYAIFEGLITRNVH
uniref:At4g15545-like C-terminal domain-containing protein n=1 Tax=Davidia involucrata TaxID=16924 RepID=A0A5B7BT77_DAVIN